MEEEELDQRLIFLDYESYASLRANGLSLKDFSDILFSTMESMKNGKRGWEEKNFKGTEENDNVSRLDELWYSSLTEEAKQNIARIYSISKNDLRYLLSKNKLYSNLFNLDRYTWCLGYLLSKRWYNDKEAQDLDRISIINEYTVNLDNLRKFENTYADYCGATPLDSFGGPEEGPNSYKYIKHISNNGIIVVLHSSVIENISVKEENTLLYFYEDMLRELSKFMDKKELYKTDLFVNYLNA